MRVADREVLEALRELASATKWVEVTFPAEASGAFRRAFDSIERRARTLDPNLEFWKTEPAEAASENWSGAAGRLSSTDAAQVAKMLVAASNRLTSGFKSLRTKGQEGAAVNVRDAAGYLYADLLRPLWKAFPELLPDEMRR